MKSKKNNSKKTTTKKPAKSKEAKEKPNKKTEENKLNKKSENEIKLNKKDEKQIEKELKEINQLFATLNFYPVAVNRIRWEETKQELLKKYRKGKDYVQQNILHLIYENITQYSEYNTAANYNFFKSRHPNETPAKLKLAVYKSMFNYNSSLEGAIDLISLLGEIGDLPASKLLTHLFNYFSGIDSERFKTLRNSVIFALGKCSSTYALSSLLSYTEVIDSERLFQRIADSLIKWEEKLPSLNLPPEEKLKLRKHLNEFLKVVKNENQDAYVR